MAALSSMSNSQNDNSEQKQGYHTRNESRLGIDNLHCCKGRVADITGSGMRMIVAPSDLPEIGDVQSYTFSDSTDVLTISGTVKWVRKPTAFTRRGEVGIEFTKLEPEIRDSIIRLAVQGKINDSIKSDIHVIYPNLYAALEINHHASHDEIQAAYRKHAKQWHPDVSKAMNATQRFEEIQQAYSVLGDETKRAQYDARFFTKDQQAA